MQPNSFLNQGVWILLYQSCLTKTEQTESRIKFVLIMLRCSLFYVKHNAENWCNLKQYNFNNIFLEI